jgi:hypothetical protein
MVAEGEAGFVAGEAGVGGSPREEDVVCPLRVGGVAGEIPHPREVVHGGHGILPCDEVLVIGPRPTDIREGAFQLPGKLGSAGVRERGVAGLPRLLVEVGLDGVEFLKGRRNAGVRDGAGGDGHGPEQDRGDRE